ncbi:hypothetical protein WI58_28495 [Burkholderia cepacia]|nr:hypothetical protein WI58_28495 [Burkholderia cepacia]
MFEAALGVSDPWFVSGISFDAAAKRLTIQIDFTAGTRFPYPEVVGAHPVHDTVVKRYRHLNFFQHDCYLEVRTPRVKLPALSTWRKLKMTMHNARCLRRHPTEFG